MESFASVARMHFRHAVLIALMTVGLGACGDDAGPGSAVTSDAVTAADSSGGTKTVKAPPTISGTPVTSITAGAKYSFVPTANAAPGSTLQFSVQNKPAWAVFDATRGGLSGSPTSAQVGTVSGIVIAVSDGTTTASLPAFAITVAAPSATSPVTPPVSPPVTQASNSTATLDWTPPTENTDDTALTNLAGYNIYYGTSATILTESVKVTNPGLTAYTLTNLSPGTWYFAVTSYSSTGVESARTGTVSITL
jgi:Putative Ig domain/Fibronectin type III domain